MDPNATLTLLLDAYGEQDNEAAEHARKNLLWWLRAGGLQPQLDSVTAQKLVTLLDLMQARIQTADVVADAYEARIDSLSRHRPE